eukprot:TRINITY_DN4023_c0_g1_i2.p1 TRINITY_DN4023_c0_g1~~TRINITY_DN4023_c0_g1_i2.p1  ORF type:complete len:517 (+),score=121.09 TRINITY_DN4023_c0_g1_i2:1524-3074(+)
MEDYLPELSIAFDTIKSTPQEASTLKATYSFNKAKPTLTCNSSLKSNTAIKLFMRHSEPIANEMRMRKVELKEMCAELGKSMASLDNDSSFQRWFTTGLIVGQENGISKFACKVISIFPDISFNFYSIEQVDIAPIQVKGEFGFLGIDCVKKKVFPLELANAGVMPLIGVWTAANKHNTHGESLLSAALKFLLCEETGSRISQEGNNFIYAELNADKAKCYNFQVKAAADPWVMQVASLELTAKTSVKLQLTTSKCAAKKQKGCSLYKLPRNIISSNYERRASSILTNYREATGKENEGSSKATGRRIKLTNRYALKSITNKQPKEQQTSKPHPNRASLLEGSNSPLKAQPGNYSRAERPKSAYGRYQSKPQNRSAAFARQIISQQQTQIQMLQLHIAQVMSTLQSMGKAPKEPVSFPVQPLFPLNNRFKENMKNCQQLNIENELGQDSPSFMKSGREMVQFAEKCEGMKPHPRRNYSIEGKMLSSIKEVNESASSTGISSVETFKKRIEKTRIAN